MAFILRRNGETVTGAITLVQDNVLKLKIERVDKRVELRFVSTAPNIIAIDGISHNTKSDTWFFSLVAKSPGFASLMVEATVPAGVSFSPPGALQLTVDSKTVLPDKSNVSGMLIRLFLSEVGVSQSTEAQTAMRYMRLVLENRLKDPAPYLAKGAKTLIDIVRAPGQVAGFENYPTLAAGLETRLDAIVETINDGTQASRAAALAFFQTVLAVAAEAVIADPCSTGLFAWRTAKSSSPGANFVLYTTVAGNDFYTIKTSTKAK